MQDYVKRIRQEFGTTAKLAQFMGVATVTVESWCIGKREPRDERLRLLEVLGVLLVEAPELLATFTRPLKPTLPKLPPITTSYELRAVEPVRNKPTVWDDDYWHERTITREEDAAGKLPRILIDSDTLAKMSESEEYSYWAQLGDYERRTGRVRPD